MDPCELLEGADGVRWRQMGVRRLSDGLGPLSRFSHGAIIEPEEDLELGAILDRIFQRPGATSGSTMFVKMGAHVIKVGVRRMGAPLLAVVPEGPQDPWGALVPVVKRSHRHLHHHPVRSRQIASDSKSGPPHGTQASPDRRRRVSRPPYCPPSDTSKNNKEEKHGEKT